MKKIVLLIMITFFCHFLYSQEIIQTIDFAKGGYQIQGTVLKKQFMPQKELSIIWNDGASMAGILEYGVNGPELTGQYKAPEKVIDGTFAIWNSGKNKLAIKSTKALEWHPIIVSRYLLKRDPWLITLGTSSGTSHLTFAYQADDSEISSLDVDVDNEDVERLGFFSVDDLLVNNEYICVNYRDGQSITGKVAFSDGYLAPKISMGNIRGLPFKNVSAIAFDNNEKEVSTVRLSIEGDDLCQTLDYTLPRSLVDVEGQLISKSILVSSQNITGHIVMTNNRSFDGFFSIVQEPGKIAVKLGHGEMTFESGERFVGNLGGVWKNGRPIEGITYFTDGSSKTGDWLEGLNLITFDNEVLSQISSPTEMINAAQEMSLHNSKIKTFSGKLAEGPDNYFYGGKPLQMEEGIGKYTYYSEGGTKILHGAYSFNLAVYLASDAKDKIFVEGQYYNDLREGQWRLLHEEGMGSVKADVVEMYHSDTLQGPFSYTFTLDGLRYTFEGQYYENHLSGNVNISFREGQFGFDVTGQFDDSGYADGKWILKDRKDNNETTYCFNHGTLLSKIGNSNVSIKDLFTSPYEPLFQYKKINNAFK